MMSNYPLELPVDSYADTVHLLNGAALATGAPDGAIGAFFRTFVAEAALRMR